jgi:hypothetical protein
MMDRKHSGRVVVRHAALSLLCAVLILLAGFAQVNHVHGSNSKSATHTCSVCSVAHSGTLVKLAHQPVPSFVRSILVHPRETSAKALLFESFLYIRPPPSA